VRPTFQGEFLPEDRIVWQLHYTEWPDFGAPDSTEEMTELLRELDIRKKGQVGSDPQDLQTLLLYTVVLELAGPAPSWQSISLCSR
jgi:protein tyrosine phosphatase